MRIGILTEYYNSMNYGALLQAWALCETLLDMGYEAEQIPYRKNDINKLQNGLGGGY